MNRRQFLRHSAVGAGALAVATAQEAAPQPGIKVGLITHAGGTHLGIYYQSLAKIDEVQSVVLADPDGNAEAEARIALGDKLVKVYKDRVELLAAEKPAMALISVEAKVGPTAINAALDAGCHVFAEKPACVSAEDFAQLATKADAAKRHLMLALVNRVNSEAAEAKRLIAEGKIGKIYGVELNMIQDQTRLTSESYHASWLADKGRAGGGHLTWLGIHWLDLAMFLTGSRIEQVAGFSGNVGGQPINTEDSVAMTMRFDNGTFGTMTSGYYLDKGYQSHLKIWGSQGWLQIESDTPETLRWYSTALEPPAVQTFVGPSGFDPYVTFLRSAVRACMGIEPPPITTQDSLHVLKTVFQTYRAAETGTTQRVE
ncbi:MAG: Gfo/Idh/MocA family oxidoreductase [Candidatus Hydrogenedentes bacterium]|nr:Gfo/Idh/MocA family oxidoreductase [Candidatus Hydrogenedentota bacterium]